MAFAKVLPCESFRQLKNSVLSKDILIWVQRIDQAQHPMRVLDELNTLFQFLKPVVLDLEAFKEDASDIQEKVSHVKRQFFRLETTHGFLLFEEILFTGRSYTGLHTHPEYLVDEVLLGTLEEREYQKKQGEIQFNQAFFRHQGQSERSYDPEGKPHDVIARQGYCRTLCLSLGFNPVQAVSIHNREENHYG